MITTDERDPHRFGDQRLVVQRHSVRQGLAWFVASELCRRHPGVAWPLESHSHQTDAVAVVVRTEDDSGGVYAGSHRFIVFMDLEDGERMITQRAWEGPSTVGPFSWLQLLLADDLRKEVVLPLERSGHLSSPASTPSTVGASVGVRLLASFARKAMWSPKPWRLVSGYADGDSGGAVREELFEQVPAVNQHRRSQPTDPIGLGEHRYWFITDTPRAPRDFTMLAHTAVDVATGTVFTSEGESDLMPAYAAEGRSIDALASRFCPPTH